MVASVLSAIMSTADSQLLVAASAITHDLGLGSGRNNGKTVATSRLVIIGLSIFAIFFALYGGNEIFSKVLFAWSAMGSAFGPLVFIRLYKGEVTGKATVLALFFGFATSVTFYLTPALKGGIIERYVPFALATLIAYLGSEKKKSA